MTGVFIERDKFDTEIDTYRVNKYHVNMVYNVWVGLTEIEMIK